MTHQEIRFYEIKKFFDFINGSRNKLSFRYLIGHSFDVGNCKYDDLLIEAEKELNEALNLYLIPEDLRLIVLEHISFFKTNKDLYVKEYNSDVVYDDRIYDLFIKQLIEFKEKTIVSPEKLEELFRKHFNPDTIYEFYDNDKKCRFNEFLYCFYRLETLSDTVYFIFNHIFYYPTYISETTKFLDSIPKVKLYFYKTENYESCLKIVLDTKNKEIKYETMFVAGFTYKNKANTIHSFRTTIDKETEIIIKFH